MMIKVRKMVHLKSKSLKFVQIQLVILEVDDFKLPLSVEGARVHHVQ